MHNGDANQLTCAGNISATKDNEHTITPKGDVHHGGIQLRTTTKVQYVSAIRLGQGFFSTNRKYCGNNTLGTGGTHQPASAVEQDAASLPYPAIPFFLQIAALKVMVEPRRCDGGTDTRLPEWPAGASLAALPWKRGHPPKGRLPGPWPSAPQRLTLTWFSGLGFVRCLPAGQPCHLAGQVPNACRCSAKACRWRPDWGRNPTPALSCPGYCLKIPNLFS